MVMTKPSQIFPVDVLVSLLFIFFFFLIFSSPTMSCSYSSPLGSATYHSCLSLPVLLIDPSPPPLSSFLLSTKKKNALDLFSHQRTKNKNKNTKKIEKLSKTSNKKIDKRPFFCKHV